MTQNEMIALLNNPAVTSDELDKIIDAGANSVVLRILALHEKTSEKTLERLAANYTYLGEFVATNKNTGLETLKKLINSPCRNTRYEVSRNEKYSDYFKRYKLLHDPL